MINIKQLADSLTEEQKKILISALQVGNSTLNTKPLKEGSFSSSEAAKNAGVSPEWVSRKCRGCGGYGGKYCPPCGRLGRDGKPSKTRLKKEAKASLLQEMKKAQASILQEIKEAISALEGKK